VVVVEHDEETIRTADYIVDLGRAPASTAARDFQGEPGQLAR
jgi:excinuclease UvrABC ATPase subunit